MASKIVLLSKENGEISNFLNKFYNSNINVPNVLTWKKEFTNPVEISEFIAAFTDNMNSFNIKMWISLDKDVFIKISNSNANNVIKYLFERYPY